MLVIANETVCGRRPLEALRARAADNSLRIAVLAPARQPRQGDVVFDPEAAEALV